MRTRTQVNLLTIGRAKSENIGWSINAFVKLSSDHAANRAVGRRASHLPNPFCTYFYFIHADQAADPPGWVNGYQTFIERVKHSHVVKHMV